MGADSTPPPIPKVVPRLSLSLASLCLHPNLSVSIHLIRCLSNPSLSSSRLKRMSDSSSVLDLVAPGPALRLLTLKTKLAFPSINLARLSCLVVCLVLSFLQIAIPVLLVLGLATSQNLDFLPRQTAATLTTLHPNKTNVLILFLMKIATPRTLSSSSCVPKTNN